MISSAQIIQEQDTNAEEDQFGEMSNHRMTHGRASPQFKSF